MFSQRYVVSASATGNSHSQIFIPDRWQTPFNIGFGCYVAGSAHYTVQHTFQDPLSVSADQLHWYPHENVVAASASIDGNYAFPVAGIRLEISAAAVSADVDNSVTIHIIQAQGK